MSRDTAALDAPLVASAAVESVAENATDSYLGPWLWFAVGGLPGAFAYRAVNTLDSMIGYHGPYEYLGKGSARLDDAMNLLPARVAGVLLVVAAPFQGGSLREAWRVLRRDRRRTESPNAGWPMAAMAGALGVRLEKPGDYRIGGEARLPRPRDVERAIGVGSVAAVFGLVVALAGVVLVRLLVDVWRQ